MILEKICEELGVEVEESWIGNDGMRYHISKTGKIFQFNKNGFHTINSYDIWEDIFTGKLRPMWKPKEGEKYYMPQPTHKEEQHRFMEFIFSKHSYDQWAYKNNLVFKTKEEAIKASNKMLESLKE